MKMRARIPTLPGILWTTLLSCAVMGCGGPILLLPGGKLEGKVQPTPNDWMFTDEISTIQLETRPSKPYSVNIWATAVEPHLYLHAGAKRANWVGHIEDDPQVRIRVEKKIFELRGTRVEDAIEFENFADAYQVKYGVRPRNENVDEVYLIRLESR